MATSSNLPPLSSNGVLSVSSSITIEAPREKVWDILLDFPKYKEWNPFVRAQTMISKANKKPLDDQSPKEGEWLMMSPVHIPPTMDDSSVWFPSSSLEVITVVDHENYRCSWRYISLPRWVLSADRWQALSTTEDGKTKYESIEVFSGVAAYFLKFFMASGLKKGFDAMGEGLKKRAEETS